MSLFRTAAGWILVTLASASSAQGLEQTAPKDNKTIEFSTVADVGRHALRMVDRPDGAEVDPLAILPGIDFRDGTIEATVAGKPAPGADGDARGFIGIAFRVQRDRARYEAFYIRPTNGRADDQLRRNHATQYVSEPEFPWHRLRKENPGVYESYADMVAGEWTKLRIEVAGTKARLFVGDAKQPSLIVNDLKLGERSGAVALWIGPGTDGYFADVTVTPTG